MRQKLGRLLVVAGELFCFCFKDIDEELANRLALLLRIGDAGERGQKCLRCINVNERNIVVPPEQREHLFGLGEPQQTMVHEHAGEPIADRLVDQHRRDRGVDAAGEATDHPALADLSPDLLDRLLLEGAHGPIAPAAGDLAHEISQQRGAVRRVHDLEVELGGVEAARLVGNHGDRRIGRGADHPKALRQPGDAVAVTHPDRIALALPPHAFV